MSSSSTSETIEQGTAAGQLDNASPAVEADSPDTVQSVEQAKSAITSDNEANGLIGPNQRKYTVDRVGLLKMFGLPIGVIAIFALVLLAGVLPNLSSAFDVLGEFDELDSQIEETSNHISELRAMTLEYSLIQSDLASLDQVAGDEVSEVAVFQGKVIDLAESFGLEVLDRATSERILDDSTESSAKVGLIEIPSVFSISGTLSAIREFIGSLNEIDDFIIIGVMNLSARDRGEELVSGVDALWQLDIELVKYQFQSDIDESQLNTYINTPLDVEPEQEVLDYIRRTDSGEVN